MANILGSRTPKIIFLFLVSYALIYFLQLTLPQIHKWNFTGNLMQFDYLYVFIAIPAFFFSYMIIHWIDEYYSTKFGHSIWYPVLLVVLSIVAFHIQYFWYWCNSFTIALGQLGQVSTPLFYCSQEAAKRTGEQMAKQIWDVFYDSAFLVFVLGAILGWAAHVILDKFSLETSKS